MLVGSGIDFLLSLLSSVFYCYSVFYCVMCTARRSSAWLLISLLACMHASVFNL